MTTAARGLNEAEEEDAEVKESRDGSGLMRASLSLSLSLESCEADDCASEAARMGATTGEGAEAEADALDIDK